MKTKHKSLKVDHRIHAILLRECRRRGVKIMHAVTEGIKLWISEAKR